MAFPVKSFFYLPLASFLLLGVGFFVCYGIGRSQGRYVQGGWPFVSDLGLHQPESFIFTLIVVWAAALMLLTMFSYHKYVLRKTGPSKLSTAAWISGTIACAGFTFVAALPWNVAMVPHLFGALVTFTGGMTYSWLLVVTSWKMAPAVHGLAIVYARLAAAIVETLSMLFLLTLAYDLKNVVGSNGSVVLAEDLEGQRNNMQASSMEITTMSET